MKRAIVWLLMAALCLAVLPSLAEEHEGFRLSGLEEDESLMIYLDDNGIDTVYRSMNQPFIGETDEGIVCAFLDYVELANENDLVAIRFTLALTMDDALYADKLTVRLGDRAWTWSVTTRGTEYDANYQEDYSVILVGEGFSFLEALASAGGEPLTFTLLGYRTVTGSVTVDTAEAKAILTRYTELGGMEQDVSAFAEKWAPSMD